MERPLIMPYQDFPFNGDVKVAEQFLKAAKKNNCQTAIETGSCLGSTTKWFGENFKFVHSIEINETFLMYAKDWCKGLNNINFINGNSAEAINDLLADIPERENVIFFLDAHFEEFCPLWSELEAIANKRIGKDVIVIHDFKVPNMPEFGYDVWNGQEFTFEWLKPQFDKIYGEKNYICSYNKSVYEASAKRGIIIIEPK